MGLLEIIIGAFVVILVLTIFMQPISLLNDEARDSVTGSGSTIKYGTDSDGNVVAVGPSSAFPDLVSALLWGIGLFIIIGFIIWIIRYGRGGVYDYDYA
jgi:hypothetical protein